MSRPGSVGELRRAGYAPRSVKAEMRGNLIARLERGEPLFPGIVGYGETVLPQVENAILSGQDIIFLGERGQAKTRLARALVDLLDPEVPVLAGSEVNDDPLLPVSRYGRQLLAERGDAAPVEWLPRERRYGEKLATPDITIADLIGEVDPIRVAEGRYLADELTIHYGLLPRTHRGIFTLNELPDLAERIQVGLLNIMEERDVQIRGYKVRLPLDLFVVASANPEDYTNRGRIVEQERTRFDEDGREIQVPEFMRQVVAELTHLARRSPEISQRSGVSVRVSIANYETLAANALRRAIRLQERPAVPRISDLTALVASTAGKIELESAGEADEVKLIDKLTQRAVLNVFNRHFPSPGFEELLDAFDQGLVVDVADTMASSDYVRQLAGLGGLRRVLGVLGPLDTPPRVAAALEFVLEGLHLHRKLNKERTPGRLRYRG
jgi:magnesium chelatase subunit I